MELKIEKGVPLPATRGNIAATLRKMSPGDSVLFPLAGRASAQKLAYATFGKGNAATRREADGYRVWRIK